jgi:hypothetical protein
MIAIVPAVSARERETAHSQIPHRFRTVLIAAR